MVSIHAPAWGATLGAGDGGDLRKCFNPRPRVGGDLRPALTLAFVYCFNPRPRVGGDRVVPFPLRCLLFSRSFRGPHEITESNNE